MRLENKNRRKKLMKQNNNIIRRQKHRNQAPEADKMKPEMKRKAEEDKKVKEEL